MDVTNGGRKEPHISDYPTWAVEFLTELYGDSYMRAVKFEETHHGWSMFGHPHELDAHVTRENVPITARIRRFFDA